MSTGQSSLLGALTDEAGENAAASTFFATTEQLDLLRDDKGHLPPGALRIARQGAPRGRPPGARNKRSQDLAKWFVGQYGHPLAALGEIMRMAPDVLYEQMVQAQGGEAKGKRITGKDVFDLKLRAISDALPYVEGKQPLAVNITGKADAVILIPGLNAPAVGTGVLTSAVEALGVGAIEAEGIRLLDDRLLGPDDMTAVFSGGDDDEPESDDDPDAGMTGGDGE